MEKFQIDYIFGKDPSNYAYFWKQKNNILRWNNWILKYFNIPIILF